MGEYDLDWFRGVVKCVCGISFLIVATYVFMTAVSYEFNSPIARGIAGAFLSSGVVSGWVLVMIDFVFMVRGNQDD